MPVPTVTRLRAKNYRNLADVDVEFGSFTLVVGRNGAGKSNLLDVFQFIGDALEGTLSHAVEKRGGVDLVRRRQLGGRPYKEVRIELRIELPEGDSAEYGFGFGGLPDGRFGLLYEELRITDGSAGPICGFRTELDENGLNAVPIYRPNAERIGFDFGDRVRDAATDRLALTTLSAFRDLRPAYNALTAMRSYEFNPDAISTPSKPDNADRLAHDGRNVASIYDRLQPTSRRRVTEFLSAVVPSVRDARATAVAGHRGLEFKVVPKAKSAWWLPAMAMSDGTLRTFAALVALIGRESRVPPLRLVAIEEPETALHPAAAGLLMDALREGAETTQVVVSTHSPDLLDLIDLDRDAVCVVESDGGSATVGPMDSVSRGAVRDSLATVGDLLRNDQLAVDDGVS